MEVPSLGLWEAMDDFEQLDIAFHTFQLNNDWKRSQEFLLIS